MNGPPVDIYVDSKYDKWSKKEYLKRTLTKIFNDFHEVPTAVMYYADNSSVEITYLHVLKNLDKEAINIESYIEQGNYLQSSQIVFDSYSNIMSFEIPLIIAVVGTANLTDYSEFPYVLSSRSRTKLVLIYHSEFWKDSESEWRVQVMKQRFPNACFFLT